jgi:hypothetical protein
MTRCCRQKHELNECCSCVVKQQQLLNWLPALAAVPLYFTIIIPFIKKLQLSAITTDFMFAYTLTTCFLLIRGGMHGCISMYMQVDESVSRCLLACLCWQQACQACSLVSTHTQDMASSFQMMMSKPSQHSLQLNNAVCLQRYPLLNLH